MSTLMSQHSGYDESPNVDNPHLQFDTVDSPEPSVADPQSLIISEAIRNSVMGLAGSMADILSKSFEQFSGQLTTLTHALTSQVGKSPSHNESSCNQAIVTSPEKWRGGGLTPLGVSNLKRDNTQMIHSPMR